MTAQEMFEKLGYKLVKNDTSYYGCLEYGKELHKDLEIGISLRFYNNEKHIYLEGLGRHDEPYIDLELYKAITQQMKELGWL